MPKTSVEKGVKVLGDAHRAIVGPSGQRARYQIPMAAKITETRT